MGPPANHAELRQAMADDPHDNLTPPTGSFLVARSYGGEIKRMYVRPVGRGAGLGRGLLRAAESTARDLGATRIVLATNTQLAEARALYASHGYHETAPYHPSPADHWYTKPSDLPRSVTSASARPASSAPAQLQLQAPR
jgi:GNAT superfamily N-acetyltransferase